MGGASNSRLALAASLIVAPLGAYAADVPTPELKDSYVLDNSFYVGHSPSGRYVLYVDESTGKTCLLDAKDGSHVEVANVKDNDGNYYDLPFCFSAKEDFLYCLDNTNYSVAVLIFPKVNRKNIHWTRIFHLLRSKMIPAMVASNSRYLKIINRCA